MTESQLLKKIQLTVTSLNARLFRNNVGKFWAGKGIVYKKYMMVKVGPGDVLLRHARPTRCGLCVGSSDLIGWTTVIVTPEMVGSQVAIFTAVEGKSQNVRVTPEQTSFIDVVKDSGGYAGVAYKINDAIEVISGH